MSKLATLIRTNKLVLKCCSLIFGYFLWTTFSEHQKIIVSLPIPVTFAATKENQHIDAPETITVTLAGTRKALIQARLTGLVVCDATPLVHENQTFIVAEQRIVLPESVSLLNCTPRTITVTAIDTHVKA